MKTNKGHFNATETSHSNLLNFQPIYANIDLSTPTKDFTKLHTYSPTNLSTTTSPYKHLNEGHFNTTKKSNNKSNHLPTYIFTSLALSTPAKDVSIQPRHLSINTNRAEGRGALQYIPENAGLETVHWSCLVRSLGTDPFTVLFNHVVESLKSTNTNKLLLGRQNPCQKLAS